MKKNIFLVGIFLYSSLFSQEKITLNLLDFWTFLPLDSVKVSIYNKSYFSDSNGTVVIFADADYPLDISCIKESYYPKTIVMNEYEAHKVVYMQPLQTLSDVKIIAGRPGLISENVPSAVNRIDSDKLPLHIRDHISKSLIYVPGIFVKDYGGHNSLHTISIRGMSAEHTAVNFDGIRMNDMQLGILNINNRLIRDYKMLEIYRGGNASFFGSGAIGGAINIIPAPPQKEFGYLFSSGIGSIGKRDLEATVHFPVKNILSTISAGIQSYKGNFQFESGAKKYKRINNDNTEIRLGYKLLIPLPEIRLDINYYQSERGVPKQFFEKLNYQDNARQDDQFLLTRLKWSFYPGAYIQVFNQYQEMIYQDPDFQINNIPLKSNHKNYRTGFQLYYAKPLGKNLILSNQAEVDKSKVNSTEAGKHSRFHGALSTLLDWNITGKWSLSSSVRNDYYSEFGFVFLPKSGIIYKHEGFRWFASAGKNFRAPTFNDLYWKPGGNPDLNPEKSISIESGLSYRFKWYGLTNIELVIYSNNIDDMIKWLPQTSSQWQPQNITSVSGQGLDLTLQYKPMQKYLQFDFNYSYAHTIKSRKEFESDRTSGNQLPFTPREMINGNVTVNYNKWMFLISISQNSFRYTTIQNDPDEILPLFRLINFATQKEFNLFQHRIIASISADNILNKQQSYMPGYPLPGRTYQFTLHFTSIKE